MGPTGPPVCAEISLILHTNKMSKLVVNFFNDLCHRDREGGLGSLDHQDLQYVTKLNYSISSLNSDIFKALPLTSLYREVRDREG